MDDIFFVSILLKRRHYYSEVLNQKDLNKLKIVFVYLLNNRASLMSNPFDTLHSVENIFNDEDTFWDRFKNTIKNNVYLIGFFDNTIKIEYIKIENISLFLYESKNQNINRKNAQELFSL